MLLERAWRDRSGLVQHETLESNVLVRSPEAFSNVTPSARSATSITHPKASAVRVAAPGGQAPTEMPVLSA